MGRRETPRLPVVARGSYYPGVPTSHEDAAGAVPGRGCSAAPAASPEPSTAELETEFRYRWRVWRGRDGLVCARLYGSDPDEPLVLRDENTTGLRAQMLAKEEEMSQ